MGEIQKNEPAHAKDVCSEKDSTSPQCLPLIADKLMEVAERDDRTFGKEKTGFAQRARIPAPVDLASWFQRGDRPADDGD